MLRPFLDYLAERVLPSRLISQIGMTEAFLVTSAYLGRELTATTRCLGMLWATHSATAAKSTVVEELCTNLEVFMERLIRGEGTETKPIGYLKPATSVTGQGNQKQQHQKAKQELNGTHKEDADGGNQSSDQSAKERIEDTVLDRSQRITNPPNLKFGYLVPEIVPVIMSSLVEVLRNWEPTDGTLLDIGPLLNIIKMIKDLKLETVAFSDKLRAIRDQLQVSLVHLASEMLDLCQGSFSDLFTSLFENFDWKHGSLSGTTQFLRLLTTSRDLFPKKFHVELIFEDPNMLFILPKILMWSEKAGNTSENSSAVHKHKRKEVMKYSGNSKSMAISEDWLDQFTKTEHNSLVTEYRLLLIECKILLTERFDLLLLLSSRSNQHSLVRCTES